MFASRFNPVARFIQGGWLFRTVCVVGIVGFLGLSSWVGVRVWAHYQLRSARDAFEKGLIAEARAHIRLCLKAWPSAADAHFLAARIERRTGQFMTAEEHLKAYKKLRGITDEFQTEWILLRAQGGESPKHEQALWNCVKKDHPQSLEILETLAGCLIREGRFYAALNCLNEWLKRDPNDVLALHWRALARENLQARDDAADDYRKVLELDSERWYARLQLAILLMEMTVVPEASRHLEILNKTHGHEETVQLAWGQCLIKQGKNEEARKVFSQLLTKQTKQPMTFYYLGKLEHDPAEAAKWFRKALTIQPAHLEARYALYLNLRQAGRHKEAGNEMRAYQAARSEAEEFKKLHDKMEREPNNPELLSKLGEYLLERFDNPQGLHLLHRALSFDPNHRHAQEVLARHREKDGLRTPSGPLRR